MSEKSELLEKYRRLLLEGSKPSQVPEARQATLTHLNDTQRRQAALEEAKFIAAKIGVIPASNLDAKIDRIDSEIAHLKSELRRAG